MEEIALSNKSSTRIYLSFSIFDSNKDHDSISKILGLQPNTANQQNCWNFRIDGSTLSVNDLVTKCVNTFPTERLKEAMGKGSGIVSILLYASDRSAILDLSIENLKALAERNCEFEIDYYLLNDQDRFVVETITRILVKWDPLGVIDEHIKKGIPPVEYDSYADPIFVLLKEGAGIPELEKALSEVADSDKYTPTKLREIATGIYEFFKSNYK